MTLNGEGRPRPKSDRPTLLVVDDETEVLHSVHDLFRREYNVHTFGRGTEALNALGEIDPHAILTDQRMPEMSGVEFLERAQRVRPDATRLLFTGYADIKAIIDAINQGNVFRYITKPWEPEELAGILKQAVEQHDLLVERKRLIDELQGVNLRLREADRLKGAFIEVASHELNTPVAVVLGLSELWKMMQGPDAPATERAWVERIQAAGKRLAGTVERMLKLLHADRLDLTMERRQVDLDPMIRANVSSLQPFLDARRQTIDLDLAPGLGSAEIDPEKIGDVLTNLVANAIKFSPDGSILGLSAKPVENDRVRFEITDAGAGIAEADMPHLFQPFFTGYDTMHHSSGDFQYGKKGIGLGLSLVKSFVHLHGGAVEVTSRPGVGSTFRFTLPRKPPLATGWSLSRP